MFCGLSCLFVCYSFKRVLIVMLFFCFMFLYVHGFLMGSLGPSSDRGRPRDGLGSVSGRLRVGIGPVSGRCRGGLRPVSDRPRSGLMGLGVCV